MKRNIYFLVLLWGLNISLNAQESKLPNVSIEDLNQTPKEIPYLGKKVFVLFYIDPDVGGIINPISNALNEKKYNPEKFGAIGAVNCKDTWIPDAAIFSKARQKQKLFPKSLVLLDTNHTLSKAWNFGDSNNAAVIVVVGADSKLKYKKIIKSKEEAQKIISEMLRCVENEIK